MHRIKYTKLTPEQIAGTLAAVNGPTSASPLSDVLAGTTLTIILDDGPTLAYRLADRTRLSLAEGGCAAREDPRRALSRLLARRGVQRGGLRRRERGAIEASCVKREGTWTVAQAAFRPDPAEPAGLTEG